MGALAATRAEKSGATRATSLGSMKSKGVLPMMSSREAPNMLLPRSEL